MANTYKMTDRDIQQLILLRASNSAIFTGRKNSAMRGWRAIKRELGLQGLVSARQLKKKWDNLNQKHRVIRNPPEGENPKNPASWPWFYLMEDALNGRLENTAKVLEPLPIDDEKHDADLPYRPSSDSEEILAALNVVEMAPIENEDDVEMIDKSGNYENTIKKPEQSTPQVPKINMKTLESAPALPKNVQMKPQPQSTQPPMLYATLLPDSTASVSNKCPTPSPSIVMQAKPVPQTVQPTVLYATLLPDSTATSVTKNCIAPSRNVTLEIEELNKKLAELRKEKLALEKEQAEFDKELIHLERDREQLNKEKRTLERIRIENERDRAVIEKERADFEREKAGVERDRLVLERDRAFLDRDRAYFERDKIFLDRAKEDFQRQKEQSIINGTPTPASEEKDGNPTEEEHMDVREKYDELTTKVLQILTSEGDQQESRQRFAALVQKLVEKL